MKIEFAIFLGFVLIVASMILKIEKSMKSELRSIENDYQKAISNAKYFEKRSYVTQ